MAAITPQTIVPAGIAPSYAAASAGGDTFACPQDQLTFLHVKNGGGSSINVTITAIQTSVPNAYAGTQTVASQVIAVTNATDKMIGPFAPAFIDGNGNVNVAYSAVTSVTVAAIRIPRVA